jgi:hypothetical protein
VNEEIEVASKQYKNLLHENNMPAVSGKQSLVNSLFQKFFNELTNRMSHLLHIDVQRVIFLCA